ncbi:MAG: TIGR02757 family protein [Bacteroidota bacterium]
MDLTHQQLFELLEEKALFYNNTGFIETDPISIPHLFTKKEDIEIAGFLGATLAWGQRKTIINKGMELMNRMDHAPFAFVSGASEQEIGSFAGFAHRTFQGDDCMYFIYALQQVYRQNGGLEEVFTSAYRTNQSIQESISGFRKVFFSFGHLPRTSKHVPDPLKGSAAKRINMYLRWMVRKDDKGVDFGIWKNISPAGLMCPLDLHSGKVARRLGLLERKQDDWTAVEELTAILRIFDPVDPVKYDFALFGTGVNEKR